MTLVLAVLARIEIHPERKNQIPRDLLARDSVRWTHDRSSDLRSGSCPGPERTRSASSCAPGTSMRGDRGRGGATGAGGSAGGTSSAGTTAGNSAAGAGASAGSADASADAGASEPGASGADSGAGSTGVSVLEGVARVTAASARPGARPGSTGRRRRGTRGAAGGVGRWRRSPGSTLVAATIRASHTRTAPRLRTARRSRRSPTRGVGSSPPRRRRWAPRPPSGRTPPAPRWTRRRCPRRRGR